MTGRHPRFSLLDSEVEGWLSDEIACGNGLRDATVDPLLSATVLTPELCRGGADLPDNRRAAQESYGSHPTSAGVRHSDSARDDYPVPRLSAATTTPRPLWGPGSAILAGNQSACWRVTGAIMPLLPACRTVRTVSSGGTLLATTCRHHGLQRDHALRALVVATQRICLQRRSCAAALAHPTPPCTSLTALAVRRSPRSPARLRHERTPPRRPRKRLRLGRTSPALRQRCLARNHPCLRQQSISHKP